MCFGVSGAWVSQANKTLQRLGVFGELTGEDCEAIAAAVKVTGETGCVYFTLNVAGQHGTGIDATACK